MVQVNQFFSFTKDEEVICKVEVVSFGDKAPVPLREAKQHKCNICQFLCGKTGALESHVRQYSSLAKKDVFEHFPSLVQRMGREFHEAMAELDE